MPCRTCGTMPVASLQINFLFSLSPALLENLLVGSFLPLHSLSPNIFAASSQASFLLFAFSGPCTNGHVHSFFRNSIFRPGFRPSFHRYWEGRIRRNDTLTVLPAQHNDTNTQSARAKSTRASSSAFLLDTTASLSRRATIFWLHSPSLHTHLKVSQFTRRPL